MKFDETLAKFLQHLQTAGRSPATVVAYSKDLEQLQSHLGNVEVEKVTTKDLEGFLSALQGQGFKNKTISRKLNSTKSFFRFLNDTEITLVDPSKPIPHPNVALKLPRVLTETEYRGLRDASRNNPRLYALIELMLQTGIRIGEVSRLKLEDIKLKSNPPQILISEHASSPMRIIELNKVASQVIREFIPHRLQVEGDQGYLFNTKNGGNMIIRNIRSAVNRVFKKAAIKNATVNDLRNTFIVFQLNKGVSLEKIAQTVGHRRFSSTEKFLPLINRAKPGRGSKIVEL
jgi:integrase/recombinase XerC